MELVCGLISVAVVGLDWEGWLWAKNNGTQQTETILVCVHLANLFTHLFVLVICVLTNFVMEVVAAAVLIFLILWKILNYNFYY